LFIHDYLPGDEKIPSNSLLFMLSMGHNLNYFWALITENAVVRS